MATPIEQKTLQALERIARALEKLAETVTTEDNTTALNVDADMEDKP